jgi:hypothetical protein
MLEVVAGHPSADELAALTVTLAAVLAACDRPAGTGPTTRPGRAASGWADRSRLLGAPLTPGRDAWRRSARPG